MAKVFIIASLADSLLNFRSDLIRHLIQRGHHVVTAAPEGSPELDRALSTWGVRRLSIGLQRTGSNLFSDLRVLLELRRLFRAEKPDVVLAYTIKPVIYGMLAARWARVPRRAAMITGLGFAFASPTSTHQRIMQTAARNLYRVAMSCTDTVFFQNPDDEEDFRSAGLLRPKQVIVQTGGSGVNLERFAAVPLPEGPLQILMIARLLIDKGVREYIQAADLARHDRPDITFHLVGPFDLHPSAVPLAEVEAAVQRGSVIYHGPVADVRPHLAACHVFVLPSYREGTPRSVLEALAVGRAVITTDAPGCRETVVPGGNGLMIAPKQSAALAEAVLKMAGMPRSELAQMAARSRALAETRFDVNIVNAQIAKALAL